MDKKNQATNQLDQLRKKVSELEKNEILLKAAEDKLQAAHQQLQLSEEKYRAIVDSISDGIFILKSDKLIISHFNKAAENLLGRKAEEVLGKALFEAFPEAKGSEFEIKYREAFEKKIFVSFEAYFGIEPYLNWYDVRVYPGEDSISVFFQVISEKKQLELDLQKARDFLKETEATGKIGGWQFDPATMKQTWTDEVFRILEIDMSDGAPEVPQGLDFINSEYRPAAEKAIQRAMEFGEPYDQEWIITTAKGNKKWVHAICKPIIENGKLLSISGSFQDISSKKLAELQFRKSEERLKNVFDSSPFPVAVVDENDQKILFWSKSAVEIFGHDPRTTEEWYELAYPDPEYRNEVIERWKPFIDTARSTGKAINTGEYKIKCKNGSVKICELYAQFIPGNLIVTLSDITEKKKSEEQLKALNQQLQADEQQLRAANQQLQANEQQLRAANQQLQANEQQLRAANQQLQANEKELKEKNQLLNDTGKMARVGGWELDAITNEVRWSDETYRIHELPLESEPPLEEAISFFHSDDRPLLEEAIRSALEKGTTYDLTLRFITAKGKHLITRTICRAVRKNGKTIKLTGTFQDVTNWKKAEERLLAANQQLNAANQQLSASEQQLRAMNQQLAANEKELIAAKELAEKNEKYYHNIINKIGDPVFVKDGQSRLILVNDAFCKMFDLERSDILGKTLAEDVSPKEQESFLRIDKDVLQTGKENINEETITLRGGETRTVSTRKSRFKDLNGNKFLIGIIRDISERIQYEKSILKNQYYLKKAQEIGEMGTWEIDLTSNQIFWTEEVYKMFGVPDETPVTYEMFLNCIHPEDRDYVNIEWNASLKEKSYDIEHRLLLGDQVKWVREKADFEFDEKGNAVKAIGFVQDITKQKHIEDELLKAINKAEESDRLKSAFLANMSHEIRTPMNGILGFTGLLKEPELTVKNKEEFIDIIEKSGQRLLSTVNDLIDISKIESGQMKVSVSEFDIDKLSKDLFTFFSVETEIKGLELFLSSSPIEDCTILSDEKKVYSILTNLIKNAIKYTPGGRIEFGYQKKGNELLFFVKDTGKGIPEKLLETIFDRFTRNDLHGDDPTEGSGLGLSISRAYVEMLGGSIWVESEVGRGSQFYFTLPYKTVEGKASEGKEGKTKNSKEIRNLKILIAEDDVFSFNHLSIILKPVSNKILHSKNGKEVVELCRNNPDTDLILMDIKMPGMSGYEATKLIREFNKDIVIIAQTAFALASDREKSIMAGCNDYISKPINKTELLKIIGKNLKHKQL